MHYRAVGFAFMMALGIASVGARLSGSASDFRPKSDLPPQLREIAEDHAIDTSCPPEGQSNNASTQAQNREKNNFYITGEPVTITFKTFTELQTAAEMTCLGSSDQRLLENSAS